MKCVLDLVKSDSLLSHFLCLIILLIISLKDVKLSQKLTIGVLYSANSIMMLSGRIEVWSGSAFLILVPFLVVEIFTNYLEKKTLFNFTYKLVDCLYGFMMEYYRCLYLMPIIVMFIDNNLVATCQNCVLNNICADTSAFSVLIVISVIILATSSLLFVTRMKFETKNITDIIYKLSLNDICYISAETMRTKFAIFVALKNRTFLSHTENRRTEVWLIRNASVPHNHDRCKIKRKTFEAIYSTFILNSYHQCFSKCNGNSAQYKTWILWCHIQKVPIRFKCRFSTMNNSATSRHITGKSFEDLTQEEFFVRRLSLDCFAMIVPKTVNHREDVVTEHGLTRDNMNSVLVKAYNVE